MFHERILNFFDQFPDIGNTPNGYTWAEFDRLWKAAAFYPGPPVGFANWDDGRDGWISFGITYHLFDTHEPGFRKGIAVLHRLPPFDKV